MMKPEQATRTAIQIIKVRLDELENNATEIYNRARSLDLDYLVDDNISRASEVIYSVCDIYGGLSDSSLEHRLKRHRQAFSIISNIIPEDVDQYIEDLKSEEGEETRFKRELQLDREASV